jgi:hypothetical protein
MCVCLEKNKKRRNDRAYLLLRLQRDGAGSAAVEGEGRARRCCCVARMCEGETHVQAPGGRRCCSCRAREKAEARALLLWGCAREMAAGRAAPLGGHIVLVVVLAQEGADRTVPVWRSPQGDAS